MKALILLTALASILLLIFPSRTDHRQTMVLGSKESHAAEGDTKDKQGRIHLMLSVRWEGIDLKAHNIKAIQDFRRDFPELQLIQLLNAAYLTRENAKKASETILSTIRPQDHIGLHLHPWKSLVEGAGVKFRNYPSFWGSRLDENDCARDCGHEIPITIYRRDEIHKMLGHGLTKMAEFGLPSPTSFSAGGWLASQDVLEAAADHKLSYDFSAVPPFLLKHKLQTYPLFLWLNGLWSEVTPFTQPWIIATNKGTMIEFGQMGLTADYLPASEMVMLFEAYGGALNQAPSKDLYLHLGFYQETAYQYLPRLRQALKQIKFIAQRDGIPFVHFIPPADFKPSRISQR